MTGGSVTGKGKEAAIVTYNEGKQAADKLIVLPEGYLPDDYEAQDVFMKNDYGEDVTYATFVHSGETLKINEDGVFLNAVEEITLKDPNQPETPDTPANPGSGGKETTYAIFAAETENGKVTLSPARASRGTTVTLPVTSDQGYELEAMLVLKDILYNTWKKRSKDEKMKTFEADFAAR